MEDKHISVIGGGSWATALVKILCNHAEVVHWWMRDPDKAHYINKYLHNPRYLSSVQFERDKINVSTNLEEVIAASETIVIATPSAFLMDVFGERKNKDLKDKIDVFQRKGLRKILKMLP